MASDGTYSVAEIATLHMYHCIDCLYEDIVKASGFDCGCDDAMMEDVRARFLSQEDTYKVWAQHLVEAIREYAT